MQLAERIAHLALATFDKLPRRCKPRIQADGQREWTPLSAIVIALGENNNATLTCISLGVSTGTKCLPASRVRQCNGLVLHDCHAEVLALRGLNCWLLCEIKSTLEISDYVSDVIETCNNDYDGAENGFGYCPFQLRSHVAIYMFTTVAPCGDASMDLLISSSADATPWSSATVANDLNTDQPLGRGHFSVLGVIRRKPARGDAEVTLSKSCTDKLALKQFIGILAFPTDLFLNMNHRAFLKGLIVYDDQYNDIGYERAFGEEGRLKTITGGVGSFFSIHVLPKEFQRFEFDRIPGGEKQKVTNISAVYVCGSAGALPTQEVLVNGVKQGYKQFEDRPGKGSILCRKNMIELGRHIARLLETHHSSDGCIGNRLYSDIKSSHQRRHRLLIKRNIVQQLSGWVSNSSEDNFLSGDIGCTSTETL